MTEDCPQTSKNIGHKLSGHASNLELQQRGDDDCQILSQITSTNEKTYGKIGF